MEHEKCYIYSPPGSEERPPKRQRVGKDCSHPQLQARLQIFQEIWSRQEERIQKTLEEADESIQEKIVTFISTAPELHIQRLSIPTGLIVAGPSIASHGPFFQRLGRRINEHMHSSYVVLSSGEGPNLKTLLKNLIKKATSRIEDDEDEDSERPTISIRNGPKLLDFDLGHLKEWQSKNQVDSVIVALQDSEAFETNVLIELIDLLYSWLDRLPFLLLFGIATSAETFEDRLSGKSLRYLDGQKFDVTQSDDIIEKLFCVTNASNDVPLRIGPALSRRILDRQKDHVQSVQDFSDGLKYAYMSHLYASYPTLFLKEDLEFSEVSDGAFEAIRHLSSFRRWVEYKVDQRDTGDVQNLLTSNQFLFETIKEHMQSGQDAFSALSGAAHILACLRETLQMSPRVPLSAIWIRAASAEMDGSPLFRETLLSIKKIPSDRFHRLLESLYAMDAVYFPIGIQEYMQELDKLVRKDNNLTPLRTQYDVRNESLRTTVVAQKVLLSKHKAALSEQDQAYSGLVGRFYGELEKYFASTFIDPKDLFLSEVFMYDLKSPHVEVFQPKPRFAIERAMTSPHDYLGCECCSGDEPHDAEVVLSATQPATAILYQLYLESGSLINVSDLWSAFNAIVSDEAEDSDSKTMALFQRALAELKYLGLVKSSRKKPDHIAKMMWKGL